MPETTRGIPLYTVSDPADQLHTLLNGQSNALDTALDDLETAAHDDDAVTDTASLPPTGNWSGRVIYNEENGALSVWNGAAHAGFSYPGAQMYAYYRRDAPGDFSSGSMAQIAAVVVTDAAPGIWRILYNPIVYGSTTSAALFVRGIVNTVTVTDDQQFSVSTNRHNYPIEYYHTHGGGDLDLRLSVQVSTGIGHAPAGTTISGNWVGRA